MRTTLSIAFGTILLVSPISAQSIEAIFPVGQDFCLGRIYTAAHLARHPKQTVMSIFIGGRNAHGTAGEPDSFGKVETGEGGKVYISLAVRFRDGFRTWSGVCMDDSPGAIRCKILPHRNRDSIDQGLTLRQAGPDLTVEAAGDWTYFKAAVDGAGGGDVAPDDRLFRVARLPVSACTLSRTHWSPKGATAKFLADFP